MKVNFNTASNASPHASLDQQDRKRCPIGPSLFKLIFSAHRTRKNNHQSTSTPLTTPRLNFEEKSLSLKNIQPIKLGVLPNASATSSEVSPLEVLQPPTSTNSLDLTNPEIIKLKNNYEKKIRALENKEPSLENQVNDFNSKYEDPITFKITWNPILLSTGIRVDYETFIQIKENNLQCPVTQQPIKHATLDFELRSRINKEADQLEKAGYVFTDRVKEIRDLSQLKIEATKDALDSTAVDFEFPKHVNVPYSTTKQYVEPTIEQYMNSALYHRPTLQKEALFAAEKGNLIKLEECFAQGIGFFDCHGSSNSNTMLHKACKHGHFDAVQLILEKAQLKSPYLPGFLVNINNHDNNTCLYQALRASNPNDAIIDTLLSYSTTSLLSENRSKENALILALKRQKWQTAYKIVDHPNFKPASGEMPMPRPHGSIILPSTWYNTWFELFRAAPKMTALSLRDAFSPIKEDIGKRSYTRFELITDKLIEKTPDSILYQIHKMLNQSKKHFIKPLPKALSEVIKLKIQDHLNSTDPNFKADSNTPTAPTEEYLAMHHAQTPDDSLSNRPAVPPKPSAPPKSLDDSP